MDIRNNKLSMQEKRFGALSSSVDPSKFSQTWEAVISIIGMLVTSFLVYKGVDSQIANAEVVQLTQSLTLVGAALGTIYKSGSMVVGIVKKFTAKS